MKKVMFLLSIIIILIFSSCKKVETSDAVLNKKTETLMAEANKQIGLPAIVNFQEKKLMKQIYELRDQEDLICYAYLFNKMTGEIGQYLGKCIGYGLPYSTQFSNPIKYSGVTTDKVADFSGRDWVYSYELMPQAEPNGLFMPEGLSATWLLLIDPETNKPRPVYIEPEIIVSPFKLHK